MSDLRGAQSARAVLAVGRSEISVHILKEVTVDSTNGSSLISSLPCWCPYPNPRQTVSDLKKTSIPIYFYSKFDQRLPVEPHWNLESSSQGVLKRPSGGDTYQILPEPMPEGWLGVEISVIPFKTWDEFGFVEEWETVTVTSGIKMRIGILLLFVRVLDTGILLNGLSRCLPAGCWGYKYQVSMYYITQI